ncbi:major facilitator superfamily domain-containing protein [Spinellus fusiger]|nr:major facilitator superfamily domain-containing protein [Spinellus fusiger]
MIQTKIGRKRTIMFNTAGFILGGLFVGLSVNVEMFILGRIFCGISCGLGSLVVPTYIGEISTIRSRGAMGSCNQFFIVIGIFMSSVIGLPLAHVSLWRINYAVVAIPALLQWVLIGTCVESPRWLISVNRTSEARECLQKLRKEAAIDVEFNDMMKGHLGEGYRDPSVKSRNLDIKTADVQVSETVETEKTEKNAPVEEEIYTTNDAVEGVHDGKESMSIYQVFKDPTIRPISWTILTLHAIQQLVGMNATMYYSTTVFSTAFDPTMSQLMTIMTTVVNFLVTIVTVTLIDRMGRRPLLLIAEAGASIFSITFVIGYRLNIPPLLVTSVFGYVASFAVGIGPIPWLLTSEMTPTYASSSVGAAATAMNWAMNFLIGQTFPVIFAAIGGYSFAIFAVVSMLAFLFTFFKVPETKNKSIEDIVRGFQ